MKRAFFIMRIHNFTASYPEIHYGIKLIGGNLGISRLESGNANPSLHTLQRLASGMNMKLKLVFVKAATD